MAINPGPVVVDGTDDVLASNHNLQRQALLDLEALINASIARFTQNIGDGSSLSYTITHGRATKDVVVAVYRNSGNFDEISCEIEHTSTTVVTLLFDVAPTTNQYRVVVIG